MERSYNVPKITSLLTDGDAFKSRVSTLTHHTLLPHLPSPFVVGGGKREGRSPRLTGNVLGSSLASRVHRERNAVGSVCE